MGGAPSALPVIDAGRREVFTLSSTGPTVCSPHEIEAALCVGDGAVRYRRVLEERGAEVPPDDDERHVPRARFHVALAHDFGSADGVWPLYLRIPDAERNL
jgi:tRNA A37 threonylcarbamoyladenosine modification protein TsaB